MFQTFKYRATMVFFLLLGITLGLGSGVLYERNRLHEEALELGFAVYNQRTGLWQWESSEIIALQTSLSEDIFLEPKRKPTK